MLDQIQPAEVAAPEALALTRQIVADLGELFASVDRQIATAQRSTMSARGRASLAEARESLKRIQDTFTPEFLDFFRRLGLALDAAEAAQSKEGGA